MTVPPGLYATVDATFTFSITWTPASGMETSNDEILTINNSTPTDLGDSDTGNTTEVVTLPNLPTDTYDAVACGYINTLPQTYAGKLVIKTSVHTVPTVPPNKLTFAPATIVAPQFLSGEPQLSIERSVPGTLRGRINPNRMYVDFPFTSSLQNDILERSTDAGNSFRLVYDSACAFRNRPNCTVGGGGDSINRVNYYDGTLYFSDQEEVVQESIATSNDHGDTWPVQQSFPATTASTGVDRQWIAPINGPAITAGGFAIGAMFSYHVPLVGEYVVGIDTSGIPHPPLAPQVLQVDQSGTSRVDHTGGLGDGYFYQSYRLSSAGFNVAVAPVSGYLLNTNYTIENVTTDVPDIFPWINLDSKGNLYAVWASGGNIYYSYSLIGDPANNPAVGGHPAHKWSPKLRVNATPVNSTVFPEVVAGDPGRVAIVYDGTIDHTGLADSAPATAKWHTFVSITTNGTSVSPTFTSGTVDHRVIHQGSICTSGTTCTGDRSLLDMIDIQVDQAGRAGVVYTDNYNSLGRSATPNLDPFQKVALLVHGPSLFDGKPSVNLSTAFNSVTDPAGDATWPNVQSGTNLPSLDLLGAAVTVEGTDIVARVKLNQSTAAQMQADLVAYNAANGNTVSADRLQYIFRFENSKDVFHMSMESLADGSRRFFGDKLGPADLIGSTTPHPSVALLYGTDPKVHVTGTVLPDNTIVMRAPLTDFGLSVGDRLFSATAFTMGAPAESTQILLPVSSLAGHTVDATPPFDALLKVTAPGPSPSPAPSSSPNPGGGTGTGHNPNTSAPLPLWRPLLALLLLTAGAAAAARGTYLGRRRA